MPLAPDVPYEIGQPAYGGSRPGKTYVVVQDHVTQSDWTPDKTPSLWAVA